jgi:uncharacterized protein YicC (UPF0701 family)
MKSMTGYGEASRTVRGTKISVQVRSLNHRHLDLQLRVPREYLSFEEEIRKLVREKISRGRIDLFINRYPEKGRARKLEMDAELLGQYLTSLRQAKRKFKLAGDPEVSLLSTLPDLFHVREVEGDAAAERLGLFGALANALRKLEASREREGRQLKTDMQSQIRHLTRIAIALAVRAEEMVNRIQRPPAPRERRELRSRGRRRAELLGVILKGISTRKLCGSKATWRRWARYFKKRAGGEESDFMLQEVQRELNTISSKVPQLVVVQLVLEGKERVEKIREQTQNIE